MYQSSSLIIAKCKVGGRRFPFRRPANFRAGETWVCFQANFDFVHRVRGNADHFLAEFFHSLADLKSEVKPFD